MAHKAPSCRHSPPSLGSIKNHFHTAFSECRNFVIQLFKFSLENVKHKMFKETVFYGQNLWLAKVEIIINFH